MCVQELGRGMGFHAQRQCSRLRWQPRQPERPRCRWCFHRYLLGLQAPQDGRWLHVGPSLRIYQGDVKLPLGPQLRQWKGRFIFEFWNNISSVFFFFTLLLNSLIWYMSQDQNDWMGPPSHSDGSTKSVPINPDQTCGDGWVCEHRWRQIKWVRKWKCHPWPQS